MTIDAKYLINEWKNISFAFSPHAIQFRQGHEAMAVAVGTDSSRFLEQETSAADQLIAEISLLSSRREYWGVGIGLVDYCSDLDQAPGVVLQGLPFERYLEDPTSSEPDPFLSHCRRLLDMQDQTIISAAYVIQATLADSLILSAISYVDALHECYQRIEPKPPNPLKLQECIRRVMGES